MISFNKRKSKKDRESGFPVYVLLLNKFALKEDSEAI